ncbi:hypothetical protein DNHGIG_23380 [Collibacillus ludicampi]|uniref:YhaN AAA domain-containing protein n=1 Tax=Collibacillus ludicampi TaxID=2771369 RepID=A0AAV4LGJ7_9BACL|nr:AAA family ATPase [Collibacillus ludicampi]GIM46789.1 hypothetical protein DNHGIG_23380 [Collibacillus ludicampi]
MRIIDLHIDGFGHFQNLRVELSPGFMVIEGPNEAGKSTLLAFIRGLLFGLDKSLVRRYEPLGGKSYGGRMRVCDHNGHTYTLERTFGRKGEPVIYLPDGTREGKSFLPILTGPIHSSVFYNVFAFGLNELEKLESLQHQEIHERIYSTGMGLSSVSLADLFRYLEGEMEKRYKPRGSTQVIAESLRTLKELQKKIRSYQDLPESYNRLQEEWREIEIQLSRLERERKEKEESIAHAKILLELRRVLDERNEIVARLHSLPQTGRFPADGLTRLEQIEQREAELRVEELHLQEERREWNSKWDKLASPSVFLAHERDYLRLRSLRESLAADLNERAAKEESLAMMNRELHVLLDKLGDRRSLDWIERLDTSLPQREWIRIQEKLLSTAEQVVKDVSERYERAKEEYDQIQNEYTEKLNEIRAFESSSPYTKEQIEERELLLQRVSELRQDITMLQKDEAQLCRSREERTKTLALLMNNGKETSSAYRWIGIGLTFVGVFSILLAWWFSVSVVAGLGIGAIAGGGLIFFLKRKGEEQSSPRQFISETQKELERLDQEIAHIRTILEEKRDEARDCVYRLTGENQLSEEKMKFLFKEIKELRAAWAQLNWRKAALDDLTKKKLQCEQRIRSLATLLEKEQRERDKRFAEWDAWLTEQGLPPGLTAISVLEVFHVIEQAQQLVKRKQEVSKILKEINARIKETRDLLQTFLENIGRAPIDEGQELVTFDSLEQEYVQASKNEQERTHLLTEWEKLEKRLHIWEKQMNDLREKKEKLFGVAGVKDEESFRRCAQLWAERCSLEKELTIIDARLETIAGSKARLEKLLPSCMEDEIMTLQSRIAKWEEVIENERIMVSQLQQRKGELKQQREEMENSHELADLRLQVQQYKEKVRVEAHEWAVFAIARALLQEAKERYEREKQPSVLRKASVAFQTITQGQFRHIWSPYHEQQQIEVETAEGRRLELQMLSRGTAEQLYLSMRIALIQEMAEQGIELPVVMDDIFVNFDPMRLRSSLAALRELAKTHQILFFTCHPHMASQMVQEIPGASRLCLEDRQLTPAR